MRDPNEKIYFYELLIKAYEGRLGPNEAGILNERIKSDDEAAYLYAEFFDTVSGIVDVDEKVFSFEDSDSTRFNAWLNCLAHAEKEAPAVEIAVPEEPKILIQKVEHQKVVRKISKSSWFSLVAAAAAIILIFMFAYFAPQAGIEVVTLTDSMNAKWADTYASMSKGARFKTNSDKYFLREGLVQLIFDSEARITLEGPVEFQILTEDQIKLNYGRLYATVPQGAIGFTINTPSARIIDLGTEFGIEAAASGDTYLHVIKGKTTLIAGQKSNKISMEVGRGDAKKVSAATSEISDIPCNATLFARGISSKHDSVWRGQKQINLADIVGGGDGFGNGQMDMGIDPVTGKPSAAITHNQASANEYHSVPSNPYIDGVFIPDGRSKQIVSSQGHIFQECPVSSGGWYINILNTIRILDSQATPDVTISGNPAAHCVLMHANMGVTYDLAALRSRLPQTTIVRFQSKFGIGKEMERPCNADFWILVDGKVRYKKQIKEKLLFSADIELSDKDRFLTLVTTDGQDPEGRTFNNMPLTPYDSDWCFFADPVLILK